MKIKPRQIIAAMERGTHPHTVLYAQYQRWFARVPVGDLTVRRIVRTVRGKLSPEGRRHPSRKLVYCGAIARANAEIAMVERFRLARP